MKQLLRYIVLAAIIIGILYAYFAMPKKPEKGIGLNPRQIIETIEQKKLEKQGKAGTAAKDEASAREAAPSPAP